MTTGKLQLDPRISDPDGFYEKLIAAHEGLTDAESSRLNARLILILANHIGDRDVLDAALQLARETAGAKDAA